MSTLCWLKKEATEEYYIFRGGIHVIREFEFCQCLDIGKDEAQKEL